MKYKTFIVVPLVLFLLYMFTSFEESIHEVIPYRKLSRYPDILVAPDLLSVEVNILILICSSPHGKKHKDIRNSIRNTWASCKTSKYKCKLVFFLGQTSDNIDNVIEAEHYKDMLIFKYYDTYDHITDKLLATFDWIAKLNVLPKYILKADDDVFINIDHLHDTLQNIKEPYFYGGIIWIGKVQRSGRHAVAYSDYEELYYPPFCKGLFYVFSGALIPKLLEASHKITVFGIDDAYIGVLMDSLNVTATSMDFLHVHKYFTSYLPNFVLQTYFGVGDGLTPEQIKYFHEKLLYLNKSRIGYMCSFLLTITIVFIIVILNVILVLFLMKQIWLWRKRRLLNKLAVSK